MIKYDFIGSGMIPAQGRIKQIYFSDEVRPATQGNETTEKE